MSAQPLLTSSLYDVCLHYCGYTSPPCSMLFQGPCDVRTMTSNLGLLTSRPPALATAYLIRCPRPDDLGSVSLVVSLHTFRRDQLC